MYKVMIVEDEWLVREGLRQTIPWESMGCRVVAAADNGEEALRLMETARPDIVLSDIRMPGMDGLELVRRIHVNKMGIETIFLTGFDDFDYARQAVKLGAVDILLKPSKPAELRKAIHDAKNKLIHRKVQAVYKDELERRLQTARPIVLEQMFTRLLFGEATPHDIDELKEQLNSSLEMFDRYRVVILRRRRETKNGDITAPDPYWGTVCGKLMESWVFPVQVRLEQGMRAGLLREDTKGSGEGSRFQRMLPKMLTAARQSGETIGVSQIHAGVLSAPTAFEEAYATALHHDLPGMEPVLEFGTLSAAIGHASALSEECLAEAIKWGTKDELWSLLRSAYRHLLLQPRTGKWRQQTVIELGFGLYNTITRHFSDIAVLPELTEFLDGLNGMLPESDKTAAEAGALRWLEELAADVQSRYLQSKKSKDELDKILDYLPGHCGEELQMNQFAADLHMSDSSFSRLFKKRTGRGFVEYLTELRMARAKDLLLNPEMRVGDVAVRVGYTDQRYFTNCFKRSTGKTPQQFKESLMRRKSADRQNIREA